MAITVARLASRHEEPAYVYIYVYVYVCEYVCEIGPAAVENSILRHYDSSVGRAPGGARRDGRRTL